MELPAEPVLRELITRLAWVRAEFGSELGERPMILPNARFFPDVFTPDEKGVSVMLKRLLEHTGMTDVPIDVALYDDEQDATAALSSCSSGACAPKPGAVNFERLVETGDGWQIRLAPWEVRHPVALAAALSQSVGMIFLEEARNPEKPVEPPLEVTLEVTAVALGMGPLLMLGSYHYTKSCGGPQVSHFTSLGVSELALLTALFGATRRLPGRSVASELPPTQREAYSLAREFVDSNPQVVAALQKTPELLLLSDFPLNESQSWLSRVLSPKRAPSDFEAAMQMASSPPFGRGQAPHANGPRSPSPRVTAKPAVSSSDHDELRSLVSEAFDRA